jgi:hypothetical protein
VFGFRARPLYPQGKGPVTNYVVYGEGESCLKAVSQNYFRRCFDVYKTDMERCIATGVEKHGT